MGSEMCIRDRHTYSRTAGIRLALPDFLYYSTSKFLENKGYHIVQRRPGTKRNIKFSNISRSLVMDIKLPTAAWVRITPENVIAASGSRRRERIPAVAEVLAVGNLPLPPSHGERGSGFEDSDQDVDMNGDDVAGDQN